MTTTTASTDVVMSVEPLFTGAERSALVRFLAGYPRPTAGVQVIEHDIGRVRRRSRRFSTRARATIARRVARERAVDQALDNRPSPDHP